LDLLADLFLAALLANCAGDILDLDKVGLYRRSGQIRSRSTLWASPGHGFQYNFDAGVASIASESQVGCPSKPMRLPSCAKQAAMATASRWFQAIRIDLLIQFANRVGIR
jgi:hypothetical protein